MRTTNRLLVGLLLAFLGIGAVPSRCGRNRSVTLLPRRCLVNSRGRSVSFCPVGNPASDTDVSVVADALDLSFQIELRVPIRFPVVQIMDASAATFTEISFGFSFFALTTKRLTFGRHGGQLVSQPRYAESAELDESLVVASDERWALVSVVPFENWFILPILAVLCIHDVLTPVLWMDIERKGFRLLFDLQLPSLGCTGWELRRAERHSMTKRIAGRLPGHIGDSPFAFFPRPKARFACVVFAPDNYARDTLLRATRRRRDRRIR